MGLGDFFSDAVGSAAGSALANTQLNGLRKFMIDTINEVYQPQMSDQIGMLIMKEAIPIIGAAGTSIAEIGLKHVAAIEEMSDGEIEGFEHTTINVDGKNVEVWVDASDPNNPIHYTDANFVGRDIDPTDKSDFNDKVENAVEGLIDKTAEKSQQYINQNGAEGYIRKIENFIEYKMNDSYLEKHSSLNDSHEMTREEVQEFAQNTPAINTDGAPGLG